MTEPDYHRLRAAEMFGVAPESVTAEQRAAAKLENFRAIYGTLTPPVHDDRGRTPRVLLQEADGGWELRDQWQRHRIWWWPHRPSGKEMRIALCRGRPDHRQPNQRHRQAEAELHVQASGLSGPVHYVDDGFGGYWQTATPSGPWNFRLRESGQ